MQTQLFMHRKWLRRRIEKPVDSLLLLLLAHCDAHAHITNIISIWSRCCTPNRIQRTQNDLIIINMRNGIALGTMSMSSADTQHTSAIISRNDQLRWWAPRVRARIYLFQSWQCVCNSTAVPSSRSSVSPSSLPSATAFTCILYCFSFGTKSVQSKENTVKSTDLTDCCADFLLFRIQFGARARIVQFTLL